jgi:4-amino-4-deoxy-L-arabinose transferase-like glycosyltransferase
VIVNRYNGTFLALLFFQTAVLLYLTNDFSISFREAYIYFNGNFSILTIITNISTAIFGQNDFALRGPFILFYIGSSILLYILTKDFFKTEFQRVVSIAIFMVLPGLNSAALLVNESIIVVFFTLLYLYIYKVKKRHCYVLLVLFLFIDNSFSILYLGLFFYSLSKKDNVLLVVSLVLFGISMSYFGFDVGGKPKSYLLDTFGFYASIFSPLLFLYFFYAIYRIGIKQEKDLVWYISSTALGLSLVFSLRQSIKIDDFAPFVVIAIPLMVKLFSHSLNVRLKEFRKVHYIMLRVTMVILIFSYLTFVFNKYIYIFLEKSNKHFTYRYHIVKELSEELKKININAVHTDDSKLSLRLRFYGITDSKDYYLSTRLYNNNYKIIDVVYFNRIVKRYYLY